jgi:hypothetical protein
MPGEVNKACTSCRGISRNGTYTCDDCKKKIRHERGRDNPAVERMYTLADWKRRFRPTLLSFNPMCQRVNNGVRCRNGSNTGHHIIEAGKLAAIGRFHDQRFVVALCDSCHPHPDDKDQGVYIPTVWAVGDEKIPEALGQPGRTLTLEQTHKLWSLNERRSFLRTLGGSHVQ